MKAKYVKRSICSCGFPALNEKVPLGTMYEVTNDTIIDQEFTFICGGCHKRWPVEAVEVVREGAERPGYLPKEIFEFIPD